MGPGFATEEISLGSRGHLLPDAAGLVALRACKYKSVVKVRSISLEKAGSQPNTQPLGGRFQPRDRLAFGGFGGVPGVKVKVRTGGHHFREEYEAGSLGGGFLCKGCCSFQVAVDVMVGRLHLDNCNSQRSCGSRSVARGLFTCRPGRRTVQSSRRKHAHYTDKETSPNNCGQTTVHGAIAFQGNPQSGISCYLAA